ncbi:hypothetical protein D3C71_1911830 [compost metagenome]
MFGTQRVGTVEGERSDQQRWPDEAFALLQFVGAPGHQQHADHRREIRQRRQPTGLDHVHLRTGLEDRRQPQHEAVDTDAPAEKLQGQDDYFW